MCTGIQAPRIGDVYYMRFDGSGSEQDGWRPGLVFQNNVGNQHSPNIIALPFTSKLKHVSQPTHVVLPPQATGLPRTSMVLCENPQRMSKDKLGDYIASIPEEYMKRIAQASILASSAISYLDKETLLALWRRAVSLNGAA